MPAAATAGGGWGAGSGGTSAGQQTQLNHVTSVSMRPADAEPRKPHVELRISCQAARVGRSSSSDSVGHSLKMTH